ncbi:2-oxo-4-hydroxy-4-carboxy-5-ureidoimidazoline decarboxylase [Alphaproteobacteria bacterium]|nr:2-oxo-4-hydroxy-4-carboxy-5-ureidoimidazoline decarboxylase [Alphaproteobacteria bacterium]
MKISDINNLSDMIYIQTFENIFEKTLTITQKSTKLRPFKNKKHMIDIFLSIFDSLDINNKLQVINNHPDLGDKLKINKGLTKLSQEEQSLSGLNNCTEQEFEMFNDLNSSFKLKFNIPFIYAVRGKNKSDIINEFNLRLNNSNLDSEIEISIKQVKKIALLRLEELIDD